jgi:hypothetical protein
MSESNGAGLFLASWRIGRAMPGGVQFFLAATVDTVRKVVHGVCRDIQAIHPPSGFDSEVSGDYSFLTVMPDRSRILLVANGAHNFVLPPPAIGTVHQPNLQLRAVLSSDWQSGTAYLRYSLDGTSWEELQDVPMAIVPNAVGATA